MIAADPPPHVAAEGTIELSDRRRLGYAEYGPPDGDPLLFFHGTPGSRYSRSPEPEILDTYGIRLISLERPGFGKSTYDPDRTFLDWPADVREATETLGIDQFSLLGTSGGGPYVLACAARMPERLRNVGIVAGLGPLDAPGATDGLAVTSRVGFKLAPLPFLLWPVLWLVIQTIRIAPGNRGLQEGVRQGPKGPLYEHRLQVRPWGFDLRHIPCHLHLWHGRQDRSTPISMAKYVAVQLPSSTLKTYPEAGHALIDSIEEEVFSTLCDH
jgi:pimeloyl-ACP methyl ester carboxylesterase